MKRTLLAGLMLALATTAVCAQDAAPPPKTMLEFDAQQMQWLGQAIIELPKKIADPFLADLQRQISERQKAEAAAAKAKAEAASKDEPKK